MKLSQILLEGADTHPEGVMVGFWLPPVATRVLAVPGGEAPEDMHLTLAYMGKGLSRLLVSRLEGVCATYAAMRSPLAGRVVGTGRFPATEHSDGKEVLYARPEVPGLLEFREGLVRRLKNAGGPVRENFDFNPHITLMYVEPGAAGVSVAQAPLRFRELVLAVGRRQRRFPLAGGR